MTPRPVDAISPGRREAIAARVCIRCGEAVDLEAFTDDVARMEYAISSLCEGCQTVVFSGMEEEAP